MDPEAPLARRLAPSLFGLAPGGVCHAACVAAGAVRSCRTFSPLPRLYATRRGGMLSVALSLKPVPAREDSAGRYPAPHIRGARTFLPGDLSVLAGAAVQPTDMESNGVADAVRQALRPAEAAIESGTQNGSDENG